MEDWRKNSGRHPRRQYTTNTRRKLNNPEILIYKKSSKNLHWYLLEKIPSENPQGFSVETKEILKGLLRGINDEVIEEILEEILGGTTKHTHEGSYDEISNINPVKIYEIFFDWIPGKSMKKSQKVFLEKFLKDF